MSPENSTRSRGLEQRSICELSAVLLDVKTLRSLHRIAAVVLSVLGLHLLVGAWLLHFKKCHEAQRVQ